MTGQLPLLATSATDGELLRLFAAVVERVGLKVAAGDLDCAPSYLANCVAGRNSNHVRAEWLSWAIRQPGGEDLLEHLAALRGCEVVPAKVLAPEERLAALEAALARTLGPEMRAVVEAAARKEAAKR